MRTFNHLLEEGRLIEKYWNRVISLGTIQNYLSLYEFLFPKLLLSWDLKEKQSHHNPYSSPLLPSNGFLFHERFHKKLSEIFLIKVELFGNLSKTLNQEFYYENRGRSITEVWQVRKVYVLVKILVRFALLF